MLIPIHPFSAENTSLSLPRYWKAEPVFSLNISRVRAETFSTHRWQNCIYSGETILCFWKTLFLLKGLQSFWRTCFITRHDSTCLLKLEKQYFQKLFMLLKNNWTFWIKTTLLPWSILNQVPTLLFFHYFFQLENSRSCNNQFFKPDLNLNFWSWNGNNYTCNLFFLLGKKLQRHI